MHMTNLFDMTAGTSTGSIIAGALAYPKSKEEPKVPGFSSDTLLNLYKNEGEKIFVRVKMSGPAKFIIGLLIIISFAILGF